MAAYESEHTKWMREWLEKHPEELQVQKSGRALWWDKPAQDQDTQRRQAACRVPQKPYYYDAN
ncbi:MAG: DUF3460 family protein [Rhodocyclales bacterium]|nr:DUF3460 family protein [Rhodocyclales bacterium]MBI5785197.1 DUF3460 family protein [Rhodocyclales bacterium]